MGRLDDMRAAAAKSKKMGGPGVPPTSPPPRPAPPAEPAPAKNGREPFLNKHKTKAIRLVERFLYGCGHVGHVAEVNRHPCPGCRAANRARRATRYAWVPCRLPPGSIKVIVWDGTHWVGTLTVPGCPEPFRATEPTEKYVCHTLHAMWAATQKTPAEEPAPPPDAAAAGETIPGV